MGDQKGGLLVQRKMWYGLASATIGAGLLAAYVAPRAQASQPLPHRTASALFLRAQKSLNAGHFSETLQYQDALIPPFAKLDSYLGLPIPGPNVQSINLYVSTPSVWRVEEVGSSGNVIAVLGQRLNQLVTYQSAANTRMTTSVPSSSEWRTLWGKFAQVTKGSGKWRTQVTTTTVASTPAYQLRLTPVHNTTLLGSVTYWFQAAYGNPLGMAVTDRSGQTVWSARATEFTKGPTGGAAHLPSGGKEVAWHPTSAVMTFGRKMSSAAPPSLSFPGHLGPLPLTSHKVLGGAAVAVYGEGIGRVMVVQTRHGLVPRTRVKEWLNPVKGHPGYRGITDGLWSMLAFRQGTTAITVIGSRTLGVLATWTHSAWH